MLKGGVDVWSTAVVDEVVSMDTNGEYLVSGEEMVLTLGGEDKE